MNYETFREGSRLTGFPNQVPHSSPAKTITASLKKVKHLSAMNTVPLFEYAPQTLIPP